MTDIATEFDRIAELFRELKRITPEIRKTVDICTGSLAEGNRILFCGNGGSASQSQHLAAELVGRYRLDRPAMNAIALTVDTSILTAVGNDYGYADIFRRQVEGIGRCGDVLFGLSTSGNSENVVRAMELARSLGIVTVAMTGVNPGRMATADIVLAVPSKISNHIQEMHLAIGHLICGELENHFHGDHQETA